MFNFIIFRFAALLCGNTRALANVFGFHNKICCLCIKQKVFCSLLAHVVQTVLDEVPGYIWEVGLKIFAVVDVKKIVFSFGCGT